MSTRLTHLKIKIKNLAQESGLIRLEERKTLQARRTCKDLAKWGETIRMDHVSLYHHRITVVRNAARVNLIAYGLLRGKKISEIESSSSNPGNFPDIESIVKTVARFLPSVPSAEDKALVDRARVELKDWKSQLEKTWKPKAPRKKAGVA